MARDNILLLTDLMPLSCGDSSRKALGARCEISALMLVALIPKERNLMLGLSAEIRNAVLVYL